MRLWHQDLLPLLPRAQILGQHRECCALRGKGWGKKHSTVDYVFKYSIKKLVAYHYLVLREMEHRGYRPDQRWFQPAYRGKHIGPWLDQDFQNLDSPGYPHIYPEHDIEYLQECISNLRRKGVELLSTPLNDSCPS